MQRAGTAAAAEIVRRYPDRVREGTLVFTGPGNNGGDGWVVAGALSRDGFPVRVIEVAAAKTPDAIAERSAALESLSSSECDASVVVDALLGTGTAGEPRNAIGEAVTRINSLRADGARVAALDIPSGLDATTGKHGTCVVANLTISFGGVKRGTLVARDCCGEIVVVDIGLDDESASSLPVLIDAEWVQARLPRIPNDAHKGSRKRLALIGGGRGMAGAMVLAAKAALRSGIGLLRVLVAAENTQAVVTAAPSALISSWPEDEAAVSSEITAWADAIVIGPGLGNSIEARTLLYRVLSTSRQPVLLDADALNLFEGDPDALAELLQRRPALLTPHPAEFARLAGVETERVVAERFDIGTHLAATTGATILLKGAPTTVFDPQGGRYVVPRGTAALGTGGSGDLLAGMAGTLLAQTADPVAAAGCAAWVHGRAAELCGYVRGTTLEDVLYALPRAWNERESPPQALVLARLPGVLG